MGGEFDLQAPLAAVEEHAGVAEGCRLDRDRDALFLAERADAADMRLGRLLADAFSVRIVVVLRSVNRTPRFSSTSVARAVLDIWRITPCSSRCPARP